MSKKKTKEHDPNVEQEYWTEITYVCPKRGKVTDKVKVKKLKPQSAPPTTNTFDLEILKEVVGVDEEI